MRALKLLPITTAAAVIIIASATLSQANTITAEEFVQKASMGNLFEIETSNLAKERSKNENVKSFAERMVTDHNTVSAELEAAVTSSNMSESLVSKTLDKKHEKILTELKKSSEKNFDKKYISEQIDAHKDAVKLFKEYAKDGSNATLKSFAGKNLPALEEHHKQIKDLKSSM